MDQIKWEDKLCIAIEDIDEQKKKFIEFINTLIDLKETQSNPKKLTEMVSFLTEASRRFFGVEEKYLMKFHYPEFQVHRKEHREYVKKTIAIRRWYAEDPNRLNEDALTYLREWLMNHLLESDNEYAPFIRLQIYLSEYSAQHKRHRSLVH